jgi:hypothetical protein
MQLAELQRAFQDHVLLGSHGIYKAVLGSADFPAAFRMGVYADAYHLRLTEALAHTYPRVQQSLGNEAFASMARSYLAARPSSHVSVRWFGDQLAAHLAQDAQYRRKPWVAELAQWEWTVAAAFDASDADPLGLDALAGISTEEWPDLRFQFHPSVHTLYLQTNAAVIFQALSEEAKVPGAVVFRTPQVWVIWRQELTTRYRLLDENEAQALQTLAGLAPDRVGLFKEMCETLCQFHDTYDVPLIAAGMLKTWLTQGLIVAVDRG